MLGNFYVVDKFQVVIVPLVGRHVVKHGKHFESKLQILDFEKKNKVIVGVK